MRQYLVALSALAAVAGAPLAAEDFATKESFTVKYSDLDLNTEKGQKALERRITKAARDFCGVGISDTGSHIDSQSARQCFEQTRSAARAHVARLVEKSELGG
jgi:UrcA family protein